MSCLSAMCGPWVTLVLPKRGEQQSAEVDERDVYLQAADRGDVNKIAWLLNDQPNLLDAMSMKEPGKTALHYAVQKGHVEVVRLLTLRGADTDVCDRTQGWTAALFACDKGYKEILSLLIEGGADLSIMSRWGTNALMLSSEKGYIELVKMILAQGGSSLNVNAVDHNNRTALWKACAKGHKDVARALILDGGADSTIKSRSGTTALDMARSNGHKGCSELLEWWEEQSSNLKERGDVDSVLVQRTRSCSISSLSCNSLRPIQEDETDGWEKLNNTNEDMKAAEE